MKRRLAAIFAAAAVAEARKLSTRYSVNYAVKRHPYRDQEAPHRLAAALRKAGLE